MKSQTKVSSGQQWNQKEKEVLIQGLEEGLILSELSERFDNRSDAAILAQARKIGFGEQKLDNGDKSFVMGVKYRGKNKVEATETNSGNVNVQDSIACHTAIVPNISGKEITLTALNMLETGSIPISPDSVKDMSVLILQYGS